MKEYLKKHEILEDILCNSVSGGGNIFRKGEILNTIEKTCIVSKFGDVYIIKDKDKNKLIEVEIIYKK